MGEKDSRQENEQELGSIVWRSIASESLVKDDSESRALYSPTSPSKTPAHTKVGEPLGLWVVGLRASVFCWLLAGDHLSSLSHGPSQRGCLLPQSQQGRESLSRRDVHSSAV